jgi:hypothetical protein
MNLALRSENCPPGSFAIKNEACRKRNTLATEKPDCLITISCVSRHERSLLFPLPPPNTDLNLRLLYWNNTRFAKRSNFQMGALLFSNQATRGRNTAVPQLENNFP